MPDLLDRQEVLEQIHREGRLTRRLLSRLQRRFTRSQEHSQSNVWNRLSVIGALATPILVVAMTYVLNGRFDEAMKNKELEFGNIKEIQPLVAQVEKAQTLEDARAGTAAISAFGPSAIPPLLLLLRSPSTNVQTAAEDGLLNVGAAQPEAVCEQLHLILTNHGQLYSWENQEAALRLIGQLGCKQGASYVQEFSQMLGTAGLEQYQNYVRGSPDPVPDKSSLTKLDCQIKSTQSLLQGNGAKPCVN